MPSDDPDASQEHSAILVLRSTFALSGNSDADENSSPLVERDGRRITGQVTRAGTTSSG